MKRIICLTISVFLAACFSACNSHTPPEPEQPQETATQVSVPASEPEAEKLSLPGELILIVGDSAILDISVEPADTVADLTFTSSNDDVAIVDSSGEVTAVSRGQAVATATVGTLTAQTEVTVLQPVTEIQFDMNEALLHTGHAFTLNMTCMPLDADVGTEVVWSSSDESIVKVDQNGVVAAVAAGKATVTATTEHGLQAVCIVTAICPPASNQGTSPVENDTGAEAPGEMPSATPTPAPTANKTSVDLEAAASVGAVYAESLGFAVSRSPGGMSYSLPYIYVPGCSQENANRLVREMIDHAYDMVTRGGEDPFYPGTMLRVYVDGGVYVAW